MIIMEKEDTAAKNSRLEELKPHLREMQDLFKMLMKNRLTATGLIIVLTTVIIAVLAPVISPYDPSKLSLPDRLEGPSPTHLLGTDNFGRDILSRIFHGTWISIFIAISVVIGSFGIGTIVGLLAGYKGGWVDMFLMRITDIFLAFPTFLLGMVVISALGKGLDNLVIGIIVVWWPPYARLVRSAVLVTKQKPMVEASKVIGAGFFRIAFSHILPNSIMPSLVLASLDMGFVVLIAAGLSFLGLGVQPPISEWGLMVAEGRLYYDTSWWFPTFPGLALSILVLGFNLLGDGIRDIFDPKLRGG